jgi:hypothetical protein
MTICPGCKKIFNKKHPLNICCPTCRKSRKRELRRKAQTRARISRLVEPHRHGIEVIYCDGGIDMYGKRTFLEWLGEGAFEAGDKYKLDGVWHEIGA